MKKLTFTALMASLIAVSSVAYGIPTSYTLLEENQFSGQITGVDVSDEWLEVFKGGDISVGSRFDATFQLFNIGEGDDTLSCLVDYIFYGNDRNYLFSIPSDPFDWGGATITTEGTLIASYDNNFYSDGLEDTFFDYGSDYGEFLLELNDYDKPFINGSGRFGWEGVDIHFEVEPAAPISEPSTFTLLGVSSLLLLLRLRRTRSFRTSSKDY